MSSSAKAVLQKQIGLVVHEAGLGCGGRGRRMRPLLLITIVMTGGDHAASPGRVRLFALFHGALQNISRLQILVMLARQPVAAQPLLGMGLKSHNETLVP